MRSIPGFLNKWSEQINFFPRTLFMERNLELEDNARGLVVRFIESLSQNDLKSARNCVNDDFEYISPLGNYDRAEPFFKRMEASPLKFNIKKTFVDGNEVCVFVDVPLGSLTLLACGWYTGRTKNPFIKSNI